MGMKEMQKEIFQNKLDKGFNITDVNMDFCLLYEELADIAIYLMGLSEILGIDLESEIEKKAAINKGRVYTVVEGVLTRTSDN